MEKNALKVDYIPELKKPVLVAGFEGWGNALDISRGVIDYIIRKLEAKPFAKINPDLFYRFDENRPLVEIEKGILKKITPPCGMLYALEIPQGDHDLVLLKANEPNLRWFQFADAILSLSLKIGVKTIVSLGSMYDNVLHTDTIFSALATCEDLRTKITQKNVRLIDYKGPGAIHSTLQEEARKQALECISIWCHCPYYLQGTTHFGLLSRLGSLLASFLGFTLDVKELEIAWDDLSKQIQVIVDKNPELQDVIEELKKAKLKGSWDLTRRDEKVIHLKDFLETK
jgi:proteasome assembly chaperone (PAC2) family protein